jgi:hypothetical protein
VALCGGEPRDVHGDRESMAEEMQREVQILIRRARAALDGASPIDSAEPDRVLNSPGNAAYKR